jgi:hypothetical protein
MNAGDRDAVLVAFGWAYWRHFWVSGMDFGQEIVAELMRARPNKLPFFQRGLRARSLIQLGF